MAITPSRVAARKSLKIGFRLMFSILLFRTCTRSRIVQLSNYKSDANSPMSRSVSVPYDLNRAGNIVSTSFLSCSCAPHANCKAQKDPVASTVRASLRLQRTSGRLSIMSPLVPPRSATVALARNPLRKPYIKDRTQPVVAYEMGLNRLGPSSEMLTIRGSRSNKKNTLWQKKLVRLNPHDLVVLVRSRPQHLVPTRHRLASTFVAQKYSVPRVATARFVRARHTGKQLPD
jgi:hypothetical protein